MFWWSVHHNCVFRSQKITVENLETKRQIIEYVVYWSQIWRLHFWSHPELEEGSQKYANLLTISSLFRFLRNLPHFFLAWIYCQIVSNFKKKCILSYSSWNWRMMPLFETNHPFRFSYDHPKITQVEWAFKFTSILHFTITIGEKSFSDYKKGLG